MWAGAKVGDAWKEKRMIHVRGNMLSCSKEDPDTLYISHVDSTLVERTTVQNSVISLVSYASYHDRERSLLSTFYAGCQVVP